MRSPLWLLAALLATAMLAFAPASVDAITLSKCCSTNNGVNCSGSNPSKYFVGGCCYYRSTFGCTNFNNHCGRSVGSCWCDDACCDYGDCCTDNITTCKSPLITTIFPNTAPTGPASSTLISLMGRGFSCIDGGAASVKVGPFPGGSTTVTVTAQSTTFTQMTFWLPEGYGSDIIFEVTNCYKRLTNPAVQPDFSYSAPTLTTVAPTSGSTRGGAATSVTSTITGTSLGDNTPRTLGYTSVTYTCGASGTFTVASTGLTINTPHTRVNYFHPAGDGICTVSYTLLDQTSSGQLLFTYLPPQIDSITPSTGLLPGSSITIRGDNFGSAGSTASIDGVPCTSISFRNQTQITCVVPNGRSRDQAVVVNVGGQTSNTMYVSYQAPVITSVTTAGVTPSTGTTAGNTAITINGSGFYTDGMVQIGSTSYDRVDNSARFVSWTPTQIVVQTPQGQGMDINVMVYVGDQQSATPGKFAYIAPALTAVSPNNAATTGGTSITITGTNLGSSPTATIASVNCPVTTNPNPASTTSTIVCTVPQGYGMNKPIVVTVAGQTSNALTWRYTAPSITSVVPNTGNTEGGVVITINGANFGATVPGVVAYSGYSCSVQTWTNTQITCMTAAGAGKSLPLVVTSGGQSNTASATYSFSYNDPVITAVSPLTGPTNGGTYVTFTGSNFGTASTATSSVSLGSFACSVFSHNHQEIVCSTAVGYGVNLTPSFSISGTAATTTARYSYAAPSINVVTGLSGPTVGGTTMTISGASFGAAPGTVTVGSYPCTATAANWGHQQIVCTTTAGEGTGHAITVTAQNTGLNVVSSATYRFSYDAPTVSSVTPSSAVTSGGVTITLAGANFGTTATATVNGVNCPVVARSHTQVTCTLPAGQGVGLPVVLTVAGQVSNGVSFSYSAPTISNVVVQNSPTVAGGTITITGTSFGVSGATVLVGASACPVASQTHTQILCTLPPGDGSQMVVVTQGTLTSNQVAYAYAVPTITSIVPALLRTAGGEVLTIYGTNYGTSTPVVKVANKECTVIARDTVQHQWIKCETPPVEGLRQSVLVTISSNSASSNIYNTSAPAITAVTTANGLFPTSAHTITVRGTNFGTTAVVSLNGIICSSPTRTTNVTLTPLTDQVTCTVPAGAGKNLPLSLTVASQTSNTVNFNYDSPTIASATPNSGPTPGGPTITINGNNFGPSGAGSASIGGLLCVPIANGWTHTQVRCALPQGQGTNLNYSVTRAGETVQTTVPAIAFNYDPPTLTSVQPAAVNTPGGVPITLSGTNFGLLGGATVAIVDGAIETPCAVTFQTHQQIICTAPPGDKKNLAVKVNVSGQSATLASSFGYNDPFLYVIQPSVFSTSGTMAAADVMYISGLSFGATPGKVFFNGTQVPVAADRPMTWTHDLITIWIPEGYGKNFEVTVESSQGFTNAVPLYFSYADPTLTAVTPSQYVTGPAVGTGFDAARAVTITGLSLGISEVGSDVTIGGVPCPVSTWTHNKIVCSAPEGQGTNKAVEVLVLGVAANKLLFSYMSPTITAIAPQAGPTAGSVPVTITGTSFGIDVSSVVVIIGGTICAHDASQAYSHTSYVCTLPPGIGANNEVVLSVGVQTSNSLYYNYATPAVDHISPTATDTDGGVITIYGTSFGASSTLITVTVGNQPCTGVDLLEPEASSPTLQRITCSVSPGDGKNKAVQVGVGNLNVNLPNAFSYRDPYDITFAPASSTSEGGIPMLISGRSLGLSPVISIGSGACTDVQSNTAHRNFTCTVPPGQGSNLDVTVVIGSTTAVLPVKFSYDPPVLTGVTPSTAPTSGGTVLTITGSSLGSTGTVTVGGVQCPVAAGSYGHSGVRCTVPAGGGVNLPVVVTSAGQSSNPLTFSYAAPTVASVTPANGATAGGTEITLIGTNFALGGTVTVGGTDCPVTTNGWAHTFVKCTLPAGFGSAEVLLSVTTAAGGNSALYRNVTSTYNYQLPVITAVAPADGPTIAGTRLTITGTNFGTQASYYTVSVGDTPVVACPIDTATFTATGFQCVLGEGVGLNHAIAASVTFPALGGGTTTRTLAVTPKFSFGAPTVTAVSGCTPDGAKTIDCPVNGAAITITLEGTNFGPASTTPVVRIGGQDCVSPVHDASTPHSKLTCQLSNIMGYDLAVVLTTASGTSTPFPGVSYAGPVIEDSSISFNPATTPGGGSTSLVLSSTLATGEMLYLAVDKYPASATGATLYFGTVEEPRLFSCVSTTVTSNVIACEMPAGVGKDLLFTLIVDTSLGTQISPQSSDKVSYPGPVIQANSLARFSNIGTRSNVIFGSVTQGQMMAFDVEHTGADASLISVTYSDVTQGGTAVLTCAGAAFYNYNAASTVQTISCTTQPNPGVATLGYAFTVKVLNQLSDEGTDLYYYPEPPAVSSVSVGPSGGCTNVVATGEVTNCRTTGGISLTIAGNKFDSLGLSVRVGSQDCIVTSSSITQIICTLGSGTGSKLSVVVGVNSLFSPAKQLVSYAAPTLTTITGCTANGALATVDCTRSEMPRPIITITGSNFGPSGATIFIGDSQVAVTHDAASPNTRVTFPLPAGYGLERTMLLVQAGGSSGSGVTVSYVRCPAGTHEQSQIACADCAPGRFSTQPGQAACSTCAPGTYQTAAKATSCTPCAVSTAAGDLGRILACPACADGYTAATEGMTQCAPCAAGLYRSGAMSACVACSAGTYAPVVSAATTCTACAAGFYSGSGAVTCTICGQGSYSLASATACTRCTVGHVQPNVGQSTCVACAAGTYMGTQGQARCIPCDSGSISASAGATVCTKCAAGTSALKVLADVGPTTCVNCAAGRFANSAGQRECLMCPTGRYRNATANAGTLCTLCETGKFGPTTGLTVCTDCARGSYQDVEGSASCKTCETGRYTSTAGQLTCTQCSVGMFQDLPGQTTCKECAEGYISSDLGQAQCVACGSGTYASAPKSSVCERCTPGTYSLKTSGALTTCTDCPMGQFTASFGQAQCTECPTGKYTNDTKQTICIECEVGSYNNNLGASGCIKCDQGSYSPAGAVLCTLCPSGTFSSALGASGCTKCDAGSFSVGTGNRECTKCAIGSYLDLPGQTACSQCSAGRYSNTTGAMSCTSCEIGKSQDSSGQSECTQCPLGRYSSAVNQISCLACPKGEFNDVVGAASCKTCPAGRHGPSENLAECSDCPMGTYAPTIKLANCLLCPTGQFQDATGKSVCRTCAVGQYQPDEGETTCINCAAGTYAPSTGTRECLACQAGRFQSAAGSSVCERCPVGHFTSTPGNVACTGCAVGSYSPNLESISCLACPTGHFQNITGQTSCKACAIGTSQSATGMTVCTACAAGSFQTQVGQASCTQCIAGKFQADAGQTTCEDCAVDHFSVQVNGMGAAQCTHCPAGQSQPYVGQPSCALCPAGTYLTADRGCVVCEPGTYQPDAGQSTCLECTAGTYAPEYAALVCLPCGVGTYSNTDRATICTACERGKFQVAARATTCVNCGPGRYTSNPGQATCGDCPKGSYDASVGDVARMACTECPLGKSQSNPGRTECDMCVAGRFSSSTGQVDCVDCAQGTFSATTGLSACESCAAGKSVDFVKALACVNCTPGRYTPLPGAFTCFQCPAGTYQPAGGASVCIPCPSGSFSPTAGRESCDPCGPGTYAGGVGLTGCLKCAPGEFNAAMSAPACTPCATGKYQGEEGRSYCSDCGPGRFAPLAHTIVCSSCAPGSFSNKASNTGCDACPVGKFLASSGKSVCDDCPIGSFNAEVGQTRCTPCGSGSYSDVVGASVCKQCSSGAYSVQVGTTGPTVCTQCTPGKFQTNFGQEACVDCPMGRFTTVIGALLCDACPMGKYTSATGMQACTDCAAGSFNTALSSVMCPACSIGRFGDTAGVTTCKICTAGKYQDQAGETVCRDCTAGTYQPREEQSYCLSCPLGEYNAEDGTTKCNKCPTGHFSDRVGSSACTACPFGTYQPLEGQASCIPCQPGTYTVTEGATECSLCPAGTAQPYPGGESCIPCTAGTYQPDMGQSRCVPCAPGTFNTETSALACTACGAGKYQSIEEQTTCHDCPVGHYSLGGAAICTMCGNGAVTALTGSSSCHVCDPTRSVANRLSTECLCLPGYYLPDYTPLTPAIGAPYVAGTNDFKCYECPKGSDCSETGNRWSGLLTSSGWWRATNESTEFYRCPVPDNCPGGTAAATAFTDTSGSPCGENRMGVLCQSCIPGYKTAMGGGCEPCPKDAGTYIVMIVLLIVIVFLLMLSIYLLWRAGDDMMKNVNAAPKQEEDVTQSDVDFEEDDEDENARNKAAKAEEDDGQVSEDLDSDSEEVVLDRIDPYAPEHIHTMIPRPPLPPPNMTYKLKIFLSFIQIATQLGTGLEIQWPSSFMSFVQFFDFANFDYILGSITSAECYDTFNYYTSYVGTILIPAIVIGAVLIFWVLPRHLNLFCFKHQSVMARMRSKMRTWSLILYTLFLTYPVLSSTILNHYVCKTIRDSTTSYSFLLVDLRVTCKTDRWWEFAYLGIPLIVLYPIGIPAFFFAILYSHRRELSEPRIMAQFGFLYAGYRDETWWWELVDSFHKLFQTSLLAFLPLMMQLPFGMGVAILYLVSILLLNPYLRKEDDALAILCQNLIFLLMLAGYFFQIQGSVKLSESEDIGMTICLLFAAGVFLAAFLYFIVRTIIMLVRELKAKYCPHSRPAKDLEAFEPSEEEVVDEDDFTSKTEGTSEADSEEEAAGAAGETNDAETGNVAANHADDESSDVESSSVQSSSEETD